MLTDTAAADATATPAATYEQMLAHMNPQAGGEFILVCRPQVPAGLTPQALIAEEEGLTMALPREQAEAAGITGEQSFTMITLGSPGSLEAVGLTSGISQVLAARSIPANFYSGIHHTHLFVPSHQLGETLALLEELSTQAQAWLRH